MEEIDYLNEDFTHIAKELDTLAEHNTIKIEINEGLEEALKELDSLHDQFSAEDSARLLDLCKTTVIETITGQFGLAGMFIQTQDGGNVTTTHNFNNITITHNFGKGVTATKEDEAKFNEYSANNPEEIKAKIDEYKAKNPEVPEAIFKEYEDNKPKSRKRRKVRELVGYNKLSRDKRDTLLQNQDKIIDAYTGKELPKDKTANLDHIVPVKEIERMAEAHLCMTPEERAKMATNDKNLAWTEESVNKSKNAKPMKEFLDEQNPEKPDETNTERFGIDREKALTKDAEARKYIETEITVATMKKYGSELLMTGGKDAARMVAYSALGVIMRELTQSVFHEIRLTFQMHGKETLKEIFIRFKERIGMVIADLKTKWKDIFKGSFEAGITAFVSNIVVFIINLFATTLKKLVAVIRAGFVSLCQAVKMLIKPPAGMDREEANYQALKILTAGLIGAVSLGLSAIIEKLLQAIPGLQPLMMFPIPSIGKEPRTVSDALAVTLSALAGGILTTIALYHMDKCRKTGKKDKLQIQLVAQSGVVVQYKIAQTWCVMGDAYRFLGEKVTEGDNTLKVASDEIETSARKAEESVNDFHNTVEKLKQRRNLADKTSSMEKK
jgi:5-methylcytosine-specific restriction endonuclease McrA